MTIREAAKANFIFLVILIFSFSAFAKNEKNKIIFGVHPLHSPQKLFSLFQPICEYINKKSSKVDCIFESSKDYSDYIRKLKEGHFDLTMPNPYQTIKVKGYHVVGKWSDDHLFKGILLVRKDSPIAKVQDLKGKKISFPAPTALAGALMIQFDLYEKGLKLNSDYDTMYVGSQESSMMAVQNKSVDAAGTWYPPWYMMEKEQPQITNDLRILTETMSLPSNSIMIRDGLEAATEKEITNLLIDFHRSEEGRQVLQKIGIHKFEPASIKTYGPVRSFVKTYEKKIGKIEW